MVNTIMIVYANGKVLGTDQDGDTQEIAAQGIDSDELNVSDNEGRDYSRAILAELKVLNLHMSLINDTTLTANDVEID